MFLDEVGRGHGGIVYRGVFQDVPCLIKVPPVSLAETLHTRASLNHSGGAGLAPQAPRLPTSERGRVSGQVWSGKSGYALTSGRLGAMR